MSANNDKCVLVVGGGIGGMSAAIEAAEAGQHAVIVEATPSLGGRVASMHRYFPKLCPPVCGLEINYRRIKSNPKIEVLTDATLTRLEGKAGDYQATVTIQARRVNDRCTACGDCIEPCPVERDDSYNYGIGKTKAIYLPMKLAYPMRFAIDPEACPGSSCGKCLPACKFDAIELDMPTKERTFDVSCVVWATGWKPYDATRIENLGLGKYKNVVTNVMFERLAALDGPNKGKLLRPSDGKEAKRVVFVQCAGSRDEDHLPYCSTVCCTASLKHACYVREAYPDSKVEIFYIDLRVAGTAEDFLARVQADQGVSFNKGKVGQILENPDTGDLTVVAEDIAGTSKTKRVEADLVVLATGLVPELASVQLPLAMTKDEHGFVVSNRPDGLMAVGCARAPSDVVRTVQDATAAAARAMQLGARR
ncbi:MAG TPA: FAD-dependent oxidoreductase [Polyangiaceae bacterium]|nr:FAD-dependent oxidoreductase [Polyangiaceae bacterium]